jgi:hypothetical protein
LKTEYTRVALLLSMRGAADGDVCMSSRFAGVSEAEAEAGALQAKSRAAPRDLS